MKIDLKRRTIIAVVATSVVLIALLYGVLSRFISAGFETVEQSHAQLEVERAREAFAEHVQAVCERAGDWASWDDAYQYVGGERPQFAEENLSVVAFDAMNIDFLFYADTKGRLLGNTGRTPSGGTGKAPTALTDAHFRPGSPVGSRPHLVRPAGSLPN